MTESHDIAPHAEMWRYFTRIITWSCVGLAVMLVLMALFLV